MRPLHAKYAASPIVGQHNADYMSNHTAGAPSSSLAPPAFPPCRICLLQPLWLRSPLERGHFFGVPSCDVRMADMSAFPLLLRPITRIFNLLLRRAPYPPPSDPASQHRAVIVSSSLDQGSPVERISSSLALYQHFGFGFGRSSGPVFGQGLFFIVYQVLVVQIGVSNELPGAAF